MQNQLIRNFLNLLFNTLYFLIFLRVILSWLPNLQSSKLKELVIELTDPILRPIQRFIPPIGGAIDISPIIAFLLLQFLQGLINNYL